MRLPDALLVDHHVLVATDNEFQRRARLLQTLWREAHGLPIGERKPGIPLGSRLPKAFAKESGANLITPAALSAARREVAAMHAGSGQKIDEDRLWANLLSSQPLAFSLFADLGDDLPYATKVLRRLWPDRVSSVTRIAFEYSPGRSSPKYTADRTAFDVYVEHTTPSGGRGFIGIEVTHAKNAVRVDAEIGIKAVEHLLGVFTAARLRHDVPGTRCADCGSYGVVAGVCQHCDWVDPTYRAPKVREWSEKERARRLAEPCVLSSDISTFMSPKDFAPK